MISSRALLHFGLVVVVFVSACGKGKGKEGEKANTNAKATSSGTSAASAETNPQIEKLLAGVPGNAVALGFIDAPIPPWAFLTGGAGIPLEPAVQKQLDQDLRAYLKTSLGIDMSKLQVGVGFIAGPPPSGAVLIHAIGGELKIEGAEEAEGAKVWRLDAEAELVLAMKGETLVLGTLDAVRGVLETLTGKRQSVLVENKELVSWLRSETKGAAIGMAALVPQGMPIPEPLTGLRRVAASLGRSGVRATIEGDDSTVVGLQKLIDDYFTMVFAEVARGRQAALSGEIPPPEGAFAIVSAAYATSYLEKLRPKRDGNRLVASLPISGAGEQGMFLVSGIGIVAAIAIPAFMEYQNKSKISEAKITLNRLAKALHAHYAENSQYPRGETPLTPGTACCTMPDRKCAPDAPEWKHPIWQTLELVLDEPHAYQYRYESDGATVIVEAVGDVDCDGTSETYRLVGRVENGTPIIAPDPP